MKNGFVPVCGLVGEALKLYENEALSRFAEEREKTFIRSESLSHKEVW